MPDVETPFIAVVNQHGQCVCHADMKHNTLDACLQAFEGVLSQLGFEFIPGSLDVTMRPEHKDRHAQVSDL